MTVSFSPLYQTVSLDSVRKGSLKINVAFVKGKGSANTDMDIHGKNADIDILTRNRYGFTRLIWISKLPNTASFSNTEKLIKP